MKTRSTPLTSEAETRALDTYVGLAGRVPKVAFIFAEKEPDLHVYVGLERRLLRSCEQLYEIQDRIRDEFGGFRADFHIIYTDGRPAEEFLGDATRFIVNWRPGAKEKSDPSPKGPIRTYKHVPRPIKAPHFGAPIKPQSQSRSRIESRDV